jgi:hypothetical protein
MVLALAASDCSNTIKNKEDLLTSSVDDIYELFDSSMDRILAQIKTNIGAN